MTDAPTNDSSPGERRRSGGCLCGGVRYRVSDAFGPVLQCHCENCRRLTGNFVAAVRVEHRAIVIEDPETKLGWHDLEYAAYGFCRSCGSTLFFQAAETAGRLSLMVGTLDDASGLEIGEVWFADEAQRHNLLPTGVPHHQGNGSDQNG